MEKSSLDTPRRVPMFSPMKDKRQCILWAGNQPSQNLLIFIHFGCIPAKEIHFEFCGDIDFYEATHSEPL